MQNVKQLFAKCKTSDKSLHYHFYDILSQLTGSLEMFLHSDTTTDGINIIVVRSTSLQGFWNYGLLHFLFKKIHISYS
jgi:hypothetical protein